jgi:hypothetical protein
MLKEKKLILHTRIVSATIKILQTNLMNIVVDLKIKSLLGVEVAGTDLLVTT